MLVISEFSAAWLPRLTSDASPLSPYRIVWELMEVADRSRTVVTHDAGHPRDQIVPFYESIVPRGYLGWGKTTQLGTGLGLAIGARLARPDWLAVNIMGDSAFGMVAMDLEAAKVASVSGDVSPPTSTACGAMPTMTESGVSVWEPASITTTS